MENWAAWVMGIVGVLAAGGVVGVVSTLFGHERRLGGLEQIVPRIEQHMKMDDEAHKMLDVRVDVMSQRIEKIHTLLTERTGK